MKKFFLVLVAMLVTMFTTVPLTVSAFAATYNEESAAAVEAAAPSEITSTLNFGSLLAAGTDPSDNTEATNKFNDMSKQIFYIFNNYVVRGIMIVMTMVSLIYGIINFVKYSKATEEEARQKARKNIVGWAIGIVAAFALIWLLPMFFEFLYELMPNAGLPDITK